MFTRRRYFPYEGLVAFFRVSADAQGGVALVTRTSWWVKRDLTLRLAGCLRGIFYPMKGGLLKLTEKKDMQGETTC